MLELRPTFQLPNDRLNEHPLLEHQGVKVRRRFSLDVLADFVNQVNLFGLQRLTQLFGDIPLICVKFTKYRTYSFHNRASVIGIAGCEIHR